MPSYMLQIFFENNIRETMAIFFNTNTETHECIFINFLQHSLFNFTNFYIQLLTLTDREQVLKTYLPFDGSPPPPKEKSH